ncbi:MAG: hypothetical protein ACE5DX_04825 [Candidatus Dojkabacteria bacterium]
MRKVLKTTSISLLSFMAAGYLLPAYAQSLLPDEIGNIFDLLGEGGSGAAEHDCISMGTGGTCDHVAGSVH